MRSISLAMMLALAGCAESPEDLFHLHGLVSSSGAPLGGQRVNLGRGRPRGTMFSSPCLSTKDVEAGTTDQVGQFSFELFRAEVESPEASFGGSACLRVSTDVDGASSWVDVENERDTRNTDLGALAAWHPAASLTTEPSDGGLVLGFEPQPPVPDCLARRVRARLAVDGGVWWEAIFELTDAGAARIDQAIPPQWLEDRHATLHLEAAAVGSVTVTRSLSATLDLAPTGSRPARFGALTEAVLEVDGRLRPMSRGAACPAIGSPCPLTDGDPALVFLDGGNAIGIELDAPAVVRTVAVRSLSYLATEAWKLKFNFILHVQPDTGERRMIAGIGLDGGLVGPPGQGLESYGMPLFFELDGSLLLEVSPPLPAGARYQLVFAQPIDHLAEVSLFDR